MIKERRYYFYIKTSPTKSKKISVPESKLTDKQKEQIYITFLDYFGGLPTDLVTRFMKSVILNLNHQAEINEKLKEQQSHENSK